MELIVGIILGMGLAFATVSTAKTLQLRRIKKQVAWDQAVRAEANRLNNEWVDHNVNLGLRRPPAPTW